MRNINDLPLGCFSSWTSIIRRKASEATCSFMKNLSAFICITELFVPVAMLCYATSLDGADCWAIIHTEIDGMIEKWCLGLPTPSSLVLSWSLLVFSGDRLERHPLLDSDISHRFCDFFLSWKYHDFMQCNQNIIITYKAPTCCMHYVHTWYICVYMSIHCIIQMLNDCPIEYTSSLSQFRFH